MHQPSLVACLEMIDSLLTCLSGSVQVPVPPIALVQPLQARDLLLAAAHCSTSLTYREVTPLILMHVQQRSTSTFSTGGLQQPPGTPPGTIVASTPSPPAISKICMAGSPHHNCAPVDNARPGRCRDMSRQACEGAQGCACMIARHVCMKFLLGICCISPAGLDNGGGT